MTMKAPLSSPHSTGERPNLARSKSSTPTCSEPIWSGDPPWRSGTSPSSAADRLSSRFRRRRNCAMEPFLVGGETSEYENWKPRSPPRKPCTRVPSSSSRWMSMVRPPARLVQWPSALSDVRRIRSRGQRPLRRHQQGRHCHLLTRHTAGRLSASIRRWRRSEQATRPR
jgi:hypothetical protein